MSEVQIAATTTVTLPPCVVSMRCLCAAHARGVAATKPCDARETACPGWGMPASFIPNGVELAWGGRAIYSLKNHDAVYGRTGRGMPRKVIHRAYTEALIDIPHDRQAVADKRHAPPADVANNIANKIKIAELQKERADFATWINKTALPALKKWCVKQYITTGSAEKFELLDGSSYAMIASPRESHGYLYITAWAVPAGGLGDIPEGK